MRSILFAGLLAVCASGCVWDSTLDSTFFHVKSKLRRHFEAVPAWGTSTTYTLEIEGYPDVSPNCSGKEGQLSAAPDGKRLAYWCSKDGWDLLYLENGTVFRSCEPVPHEPKWKKAKTFKAAAADLSRCADFQQIVAAFAAQADPKELEALFVEAFEQGPTLPFRWVDALQARPELRTAVLDRVRKDLGYSEEKWTKERVDAVVKLAGESPLGISVEQTP